MPGRSGTSATFQFAVRCPAATHVPEPLCPNWFTQSTLLTVFSILTLPSKSIEDASVSEAGAEGLVSWIEPLEGRAFRKPGSKLSNPVRQRTGRSRDWDIYPYILVALAFRVDEISKRGWQAVLSTIGT